MYLLLIILIGVILGMFFPIQASFGAKLSRYSRTPMIASFVAFFVGTLLLIGINLLANPSIFSMLGNWQNISWYLLIGGGLTGISYNLINIILFKKIGASVTTVLTLTGQMVMALLIDHFGLFGTPVQSLSMARVAGVLIMTVGVMLAQLQGKRVRQQNDGHGIWLILGVLGGCLPPLQQVFNSQLSHVLLSPLGAALVSFSVGLSLISLVILGTEKKISVPRVDPSGQKIPLSTYSAGIFGIFIVVGNILLLPILGSVMTIMVFILGQLIMSLLIDQFGLFHLPQRKLTIQKVMTIIMTILGIILVKQVG